MDQRADHHRTDASWQQQEHLPVQVPVLLLSTHTGELSPGTVDCVDSRVVDVAAKPSVCSVVCIPHM